MFNVECEMRSQHQVCHFTHLAGFTVDLLVLILVNTTTTSLLSLGTVDGSKPFSTLPDFVVAELVSLRGIDVDDPLSRLMAVRPLRDLTIVHGAVVCTHSTIWGMNRGQARKIKIYFIFTYPLTVRVTGAPQIISQPVSSIFSVLHCPLGPGELQACSFPDTVFPPLLLSALSSSPLHCVLQDGFD